MNNLVKLFALVLGLGLSTTLIAQKSLPSVEVKDLNGKAVNIQQFAENGKITVLSFWATWCSPCKKELDAIAEVYEDWQEDYNMELVAVTIDTRRALSKVPGIVKSKGWDYTVLSDSNQKLQQALNFQSVPHTILINSEGEVVYTHSGYVPGDEYELEDKIKALAKGK